ncbi:hypothetical protein TNCV_2102411 [Trichonephila clavipes]|nr:hypothetical protein TNCV_2102411 [Trichonephila clavipes]
MDDQKSRKLLFLYLNDQGGVLSRIPTKVIFQWVSSRCGLWGNAMVELFAKRGTDILQRSIQRKKEKKLRDLSLHSAKPEINRIYKKCFRDAATSGTKNKSWTVLIKPMSRTVQVLLLWLSLHY